MDVPEEALKRIGGKDRTRASRMVHQIDCLGTSGHGVHIRQAEERELLLSQPCTLFDYPPDLVDHLIEKRPGRAYGRLSLGHALLHRETLAQRGPVKRSIFVAMSSTKQSMAPRAMPRASGPRLEHSVKTSGSR